MRRFLYLVLLVTVPLAAGCLLFYVDHPDSTTAGSTIDINVVLTSESTPSGAQTPVACIAYPAAWGSVRSATYTAQVGGIDTISGSGVLAAAEAAKRTAAMPLPPAESLPHGSVTQVPTPITVVILTGLPPSGWT